MLGAANGGDPLATFTVGIGVGSLLCERLSSRHVELGLVPFGSIGLTVFWFRSGAGIDGAGAGFRPFASLATLLAHLSTWRILADLLLIGLLAASSLCRSMRWCSCAARRSAPASLPPTTSLNALFMVVGAIAAAAGLLGAGLSIPCCLPSPPSAMPRWRCSSTGWCPSSCSDFAWLLIHSLYRVQKRGVEHIPHEGAALIVCNHVSFVDPVILMAVSPRPIRFVMDHRIFRTPIISFIFRHTVPSRSHRRREDPAMMERAFAEVGRALDAGNWSASFPKGDYRHRRDVSVPSRRDADSRTQCGAGDPLALQGCGAVSFRARTGRRCRSRSGAACSRRSRCRCATGGARSGIARKSSGNRCAASWRPEVG